MNKNIIEDDAENLKTVFLQSEYEYLNELIKTPYYSHILKRFHNQNPEDLYKLATDMIKSIELGEVKPEDLDVYEGTISILLLCTHESIRESVKKICKEQREKYKKSQKNNNQQNKDAQISKE